MYFLGLNVNNCPFQRDQRDVYAHVGVGNIWLEQLAAIRHPPPDQESRAKSDKLRKRALDYYLRALKLQPNCIWATHGVGCVLATVR